MDRKCRTIARGLLEKTALETTVSELLAEKQTMEARLRDFEKEQAKEMMAMVGLRDSKQNVEKELETLNAKHERLAIANHDLEERLQGVVQQAAQKVPKPSFLSPRYLPPHVLSSPPLIYNSLIYPYCDNPLILPLSYLPMLMHPSNQSAHKDNDLTALKKEKESTESTNQGNLYSHT